MISVNEIGRTPPVCLTAYKSSYARWLAEKRKQREKPEPGDMSKPAQRSDSRMGAYREVEDRWNRLTPAQAAIHERMRLPLGQT